MQSLAALSARPNCPFNWWSRERKPDSCGQLLPAAKETFPRTENTVPRTGRGMKEDPGTGCKNHHPPSIMTSPA